MAPDDFDAPLNFVEDFNAAMTFGPDPNPTLSFTESDDNPIAFDPLLFDLISLAPIPGYVVTADAEGRPVWLPPSGVVGAQGPQGNQGPPGRDGLDGEPGPMGPQGPRGATGATGSTGAQGPQGLQGPPGPEGPQGPEGLQGQMGAPGLRGLTGATGATGGTGAVGPAGTPTPYVPLEIPDYIPWRTGTPPLPAHFVVGVSPAFFTGDGDTILQVNGANSAFAIVTVSAIAERAMINLTRADGTRGSESAVQNLETIGQIEAHGYGSTGYSSTGRAAILFQANQNWTDANQGARIAFWTTPDGSTTLTEAMHITATQSVRIAGHGIIGSLSAPSNTTAGDLTATRLHLGTDAAFSSGMSLQVNNGQGIISQTSNSTGTLNSTLNLTGSRANNTDAFQCALHIDSTFSGSGDSPSGVYIRPTFTPSASLTEAFGLSMGGFFNPALTKTITSAIGVRAIVANSAGSGAITNAIGIRVDNYSGSITPTNVIGLYIQAQSGGTNNYDMGFGTVDTAAAGAYYGKIPVLYNGLKKYLHVFS